MSPPRANYSQYTPNSGTGYGSSYQSTDSSDHQRDSYGANYSTTSASYSRSPQPTASGNSYYNTTYSTASTAPTYTPGSVQSQSSWHAAPIYQTTPSSEATNHGLTSHYQYLSQGPQSSPSLSTASQSPYPYHMPTGYAVSQQPPSSYAVPSSQSYLAPSAAQSSGSVSPGYYSSPYNYQELPRIHIPDDQQQEPEDQPGVDHNMDYSPSPSPSATSPGNLGSKTPSRTNSGRIKEKQTYKCDKEGCTSSAQFTRLADLQRHQDTVHTDNKPFPCTVNRCVRVGPRGFNRRDHLTEHLRSYHQMNIPKRAPGQRSAPQGFNDL